MAITTSLLMKLSTIFSGRQRRSRAAPTKSAEVTEADRPRFPRPSLRVFLLLILAIALSPVLVIGGVQWSNDIRRENHRRQLLMSLVAEEAADRSQIVLATAPALLDVIAAIEPTEACSAEFAKVIVRFPQFGNLSVVNADGEVVCSALDYAKGVSVADREWFQKLRDTGIETVQSTVYPGRVTKVWVMAVARRRQTASGAFDGAMVLGVPVTSLTFSLDRTGLPEDSEIALVDATGRVFGSNNWQMLDRSLLDKVQKKRGGFFVVKASNGVEREMSLVPLSTGPLFAVLSAPRPAPIALENVSAFGNFALPLLAWFLALATAWLATDRLVLRWLDYLRRIASLYASGKLSVQPLRARRSAPTEITGLADTLEDMAVKIRDRTTNLELAIEARDAAMKEIHHRVKNNLQIINSLLSLQSRKVSDPAAVAVLDDARGRINALSLIHRSLYETSDIRTVSTKNFFGDLVAHLNDALGAEDLGISIGSDIDQGSIDADLAVPLALFTAEAVTNAIKHAFPNARPGRVMVSYRIQPEETVLSIEDNGVGAATKSSTGLGSTLMAAFAKQAHGTLEDMAMPVGGQAVRIRIPNRGPAEAADPAVTIR
jgi:two-component sensor histidine kinase